jgi:type IV fimbrial biogenesis protein FimT
MMIAIALLAIVVTLAVPNFSLWIRNLGIRNAAESIQSGLTLARNEALKRNTRMCFQLTASDGGDDDDNGEEGSNWAWVVAVGKCNAGGDDPEVVRSYDGKQSGGNNVRIDAGKSFTFNGLGRLTSTPANIDVRATNDEGGANCASGGDDGKPRCLRIEVTAGGIRMCDPDSTLPSTDTRACTKPAS